MSETPTPAILSAKRLTEIRAQLDVPRASNSYVTDYGVAADVVDELIDHITAREAAFTKALKALRDITGVVSDSALFDAIEQAAADLGLDIDN